MAINTLAIESNFLPVVTDAAQTPHGVHAEICLSDPRDAKLASRISDQQLPADFPSLQLDGVDPIGKNDYGQVSSIDRANDKDVTEIKYDTDNHTVLALMIGETPFHVEGNPLNDDSVKAIAIDEKTGDVTITKFDASTDVYKLDGSVEHNAK